MDLDAKTLRLKILRLKEMKEEKIQELEDAVYGMLTYFPSLTEKEIAQRLNVGIPFVKKVNKKVEKDKMRKKIAQAMCDNPTHSAKTIAEKFTYPEAFVKSTVDSIQECL